MNSDQMKGKFKQLSGEIKRKWGQVTDDDLTEAQGNVEKLVGKIQERSGDQREAIEKWLKSQGMNPSPCDRGKCQGHFRVRLENGARI
jgi:uncharacterized protein YjbJ (UPF0337 family)